MKTKQFVHLHVHSHYSIMNGCNTVPQLVDRAIKDRMNGMALTDTGNMCGIMEFFDYVNKVNSERNEKGQEPFKPIIGCELYLSPEKGESAYPLTLLAKNLMGYQNQMKLVSLSGQKHENGTGYTDYTTLEHYHEGIIVCSGGIGSEVSHYALQNDKDNLTKVLGWFKRVFADDYYVELQRTTDETKYEKALQVLVKAAREQQIKLVAANDVRYTTKRYAEAYEYQNRIALGDSMPKNWPESANQKWLKSRNDMKDLFADIPEAIESTMEILEKVEFYDIHHAPVFPKASLDNTGLTQGNSDDDNLCELVYEKAKQIYGCPLPEDVDDRLRFELDVIKEHNSSGYFLFVQELATVAKEQLGVLVGPGRGSAAGSLVSYCLGITKIDPLKHDLLFERFLCPELPYLPDIDLDFDAAGRTRIIEWLEQRYGKECCAYIITFTKLSARKAILLLGQVEGWSNHFSKSVCHLFLDDANLSQWTLAVKRHLRSKADVRRVLRIAKMLEDTIYNTGIHACGFVVINGPIDDYAPTSQMEAQGWNRGVSRCVQYDGDHVESTGLVKMDFLWLDTLTEQKTICERIKESRGIDINLDLVPIDDAKTFELFQNGETKDIFCFDLDGMKKCLRKLRPTQFEDLVLLNALYRPGVKSKITKLIAHKTGKKEIRYDIPCMEKYLHDSYGILAYQEQLMLLSRLIADFSRKDSDLLRIHLGKRKQLPLLVLRRWFIQGGLENGHETNILKKIWNDWEKSGTYLFNKAHAVCYSWIGYQMAYLKANYPNEFAEVMSSKEQ
ncbi:MAG: DNA polymerase III subunit alpha [Bacteroidaceae bacterium]|nr:DNA polymerase III subunit alpha [Bacteroidaceae bacterium]